MKRSLLLSVILVFFTVSAALAGNRYWVGGTGSWNDESHWSETSGGKGGASVPTSADDVYFDANSFKAQGGEVGIRQQAFGRTLSWKGINASVKLTGSSKSELHINGSLYLSSLLDIQYEGKIYFEGNDTGNIIVTSGKAIKGDIYFNGANASWKLGDHLEALSTIYLQSGSLNTDGFNISCSSFYGSGSSKRALDLVTSKIEIRNEWNFEESTNLELKAKGAEIIFHKLDHQTFRSGKGLYYGNLRVAGNGDQPSPLSHTVTTTVVPNPCNGDCIATATAVVTPATGTYTYLWTPGNQTTQTATGLCAGTYLVVVTDSVTGDQVPAFATVVDPPPLVIFFSNVPATCNGTCNGSSSAIVAGGTAPYTYLWNPTPPNGNGTSSATNLCAGSYTLTITDANGCVRTQTTTITEPSLINPNGTFSNVTCNGFCDGTASVNPSGGTPPFTVTWSPGNVSGNNLSNLCPGTYTANITDANGCTATYTAVITQPAPLAVTTTNTNASCGGVCDGTSSSNVTGGTPPYSYSWAPGGQTTPSISGLCAGTYTLTVTDANNCVVTQNVTITEPSILTTNPTGVNITCFNACNGTASANAAGGTPPYTYSWSNSQTTAVATNLCPGTYTVNVTDANGCTTSGSVTISEPSLLVAGATGTNISCNSACDGTATANPTGGTGPYTYTWSPGNLTTQTITGLCPGTYTVTVADSNSCTAVQTVTITEPLPLLPNAFVTNVSCFGACDGSATANPTGGTGPYTFVWSGGQTTQTISGLCAGNYSVTVTDANGCMTTSSVTVTQPNPLNVSATATPIACNTFCTSTISANIAGGTAPYQYSWSPGGQTTASITGQCSGSYTVTVTDANSCVATASVTVNQPTALNVVTTSNNTPCNSTCNGSAAAITGGGTPPYQYSWLPGGQTTTSINNLCAGSYTLTVTDDNGCQGTGSVTITEPQQLLSNATSTNVTCNNACNGTATANPSGGTPPYAYQWMPGNMTTQSVSNLCAGSYTVTITDANNCTSTQIIQITQPTPLSPVASALSSSCNICNGSGTVNVTGGTPPYSFLWNDPNAQTTATATGLCPGNYTITVTDANNCVSTATVTITQTVNIVITSSSSSLDCFGDCDGIATANASGGASPYSFLWSTNPIQFTGTATGLCSGTYSVTATDANGCFNTATVTFNDPPVLTATMSSTSTSCNAACDGTATAAPAGGTGPYSYQWSNGQNVQTATGLCAGTYTVTVYDANLCAYTDSVTVSQAPSIAANATVTDANCSLSDGSITLAPSGGIPPYTFLWSTGATTQNLTNIPAGSYTVTITDNAGCAGTFTIAVNNLNGPSLSITGTEVSCFGSCDGTSSVTIAGGTPPFTYLWSPGGQTTSSVSGLCEGIYNVQVTDGVGCITIATDTVTEPQPLASNATIVNASCGGVCDGSVTLNVSGGSGPYTYSWLPGGQTTSSVNGLCAGSYTVTITDNNGCDTTLTFNITEPTLLDVTVSSSNVLCAGACNGTASAAPVGGTPGYSFSWSHGPVLGNVVNLCPGSYTVTVTDANGCSAVDSVNITEPPLLISTVAVTNALCNLACNGTATINGSGGTPGYTYSWSPGGQTTQTVNNLCAGAYNVVLTDANGCTSSQQVIVTEPAALNPGAVATNTSCNGVCDGAATASPSGGTAPYTYSWAPGGMTTQTISGLCPGSYTVTVTDAGGCTATQTVSVGQPPALMANTSSVSPLCAGDCNGSVTASPVGGTSPYTYVWSPGGQTTQTVNNLCAGSYTVVVSDANGCSTSQTIAVTNPPAIDIVTSVAPANCGVNNGSITVTPITGSAPYTYTWNPPVAAPNSPTANNLGAGMYTVTVTDSDGCDSTFVVTLNNSGGPTGASVSTVEPLCNGLCTGISSLSPIGGTAPYAYNWYDVAGNPLGVTNDTATSLCAGIYVIEITDANGCLFYANDTVNQPTPVISNGIISQSTCSGICDGAITVAPSGGTGPYTFSWQPGNLTTPAITNLCSGTYAVTITDANACTMTDSFVVTPATVLAMNLTSVNAGCGNACNGSATATVTSGTAPYSYLWNDPFSQTASTASNLCPGTYNLTLTDAQGCNITQQVTINSGSNIAINPAVTPTTCGQCDGQVTANASGGAGPLTYLWSDGQTTSTATNLCGGLYSLTVTDSVGCSTSFQVPVSSVTAITASNAITNESCQNACDGAATVTPSGGTPPYSFLWIQTGQTTNAASNLCAGQYFVEITDSMGCTYMHTVTIGSPNTINDNSSIINATCGSNDGSITFNPTGGTAPYTYVWSPNVSSTNSATNLSAGIYTVTITDANGCSQTVNVPISTTNGPLITASSTDGNCSGSCNGTADVDATGTAPFTYQWSNGQTTDSISGLCTGNYLVQVTDGSGCVSSAQVLVSEPSALTYSMANVVNETCPGSCNGSATVIPSGGTLPYTFLWQSGGQTTQTATNLCAGVYNVTITDANGCSVVQQVIIGSSPNITLATSITNATCNQCDGQISATASGGMGPLSYLWSDGQTSQMITNVCAGVYSVMVTDSLGCSATFQVPVSNVTAVTATNTVTNASCAGTCDGSASIVASGGIAPYSFLWIPGGQTTATLNNLCAGLYFVQVTDTTGCAYMDSVVIGAPSQIIANSMVVDATCGNNNGSVTLNPSGGTGPYTFAWSPNVSSTSSAANLAAGIYTVTITDASGCSEVVSIPVSNTGGPAFTVSSTNISCNGACDATIDVDASGNAPFTYQWSNGQTTDSISGLCPGTYAIQVTDAGGCVSSYQVSVVEPSPLAFSAPIIVNLGCAATCNGSATVVPSGGTLPYTYAWSDGQTTATAAGLCAGTYTVTVTDAVGCSITTTVTLTSPPAITISSTTTSASCNTANDGAIDVTVTGGSAPYSFQWSGGSSAVTEDLVNILPGLYIVTVTDANGCPVSDTITIISTVTVLADAGNDTTFCESGAITLNGSGSSNATSFAWYQLPSMNQISTGVTATVTPPAGSTSYMIVAFNGTCSDTDTVVVTSNTPPLADAGTDATILIFNSVAIGGNPTGVAGSTFSWTPAGSLSDSTAANPVASPTVTTTYTVTVTNANGCTAIDTVRVTVLPQIVFPNGISPNGDGSNDTWIIDNIDQFPNCVVEVYNRWGELLFRSEGYNDPWDGTYKGEQLPVGTYYYIINLNDELYPEAFTGPITILR